MKKGPAETGIKKLRNAKLSGRKRGFVKLCVGELMVQVSNDCAMLMNLFYIICFNPICHCLLIQALVKTHF